MNFNTQFNLFKQNIEDITLIKFPDIKLNLFAKNHTIPYVHCLSKNKKRCEKLIFNLIMRKLVNDKGIRLLLDVSTVHVSNLKSGIASSKMVLKFKFIFGSIYTTFYKFELEFNLPYTLISINEGKFKSNNKIERLRKMLNDYFNELVNGKFIIKSNALLPIDKELSCDEE